MAKFKKVCRKCRIFVKSDKCPLCQGNDLSTSHAGLALIFNPESEIAKEMGIEVPGDFALKVR